MKKIIPFEKVKKKKKAFNPNKRKDQMATEKATTKCPAVLNPQKDGSSIDVDYAELEPDGQIEFWKNIEKEEEERFRTKYKDVLAVVPIDAGAKMQYFAAAMLKLIPNIFHNISWDTRFDTFMDFCQFYITEFEPAYGDYLQENKELEKPYLYKFKDMATEKLEEKLEDCLKKIVEICLEKQEEDKAEMLYQSARLFELEEILSDMFYKELLKE